MVHGKCVKIIKISKNTKSAIDTVNVVDSDSDTSVELLKTLGREVQNVMVLKT